MQCATRLLAALSSLHRSPDRHGTLIWQDDTPKPTNPDVYIHGTPSATFFVSQYAGFGQDDITVSLKVPLHLLCCEDGAMRLGKQLPFLCAFSAFVGQFSMFLRY